MKGKTKFKAESSPIGERVTSHKRISAPALTFPFKKLVFTAMKIHSLSEKTVSVFLTLIFATDTGIALTAPLIRLPSRKHLLPGRTPLFPKRINLPPRRTHLSLKRAKRIPSRRDPSPPAIVPASS